VPACCLKPCCSHKRTRWSCFKCMSMSGARLPCRDVELLGWSEWSGKVGFSAKLLLRTQAVLSLL
jgi:hypothetical protein